LDVGLRIFLIVDGPARIQIEGMSFPEKKTKQGVRDLDFGVPKKPHVVTVGEKPSADGDLAPRLPVPVPSVPAATPPIEK
jgi:hypothetical protein